VRSAHLDEMRGLSLQTDGAALKVRIPELCPVVIPPGGGGKLALTARPLLSLGRDLAQIGYDTFFEVTAELGCAEAAAARVEFRQTEGPPLAEWSVAEGSARLRARTLPLSRFLPEPLPAGIVAVSPRTQGRYVIEATLSGASLPTVRRSVVVTSSARATGLSSLAISQRVMLGGAGWRVERAPGASQAKIEPRSGGVSTFTPDVAGRWILADGAGRRLPLQATTHDRPPLDCGRSDCHASLASAALSTPMTHALARPLALLAENSASVSCSFDCHVVGERGLQDGGFLDTAERLGFRASGRLAFDGLPHALQRLGGVRCTSCHGPGVIPEPDDRARVLRVSVCATCHDAPPSYEHVQAWRRSAMSRSDREAATREPGCARCHTTGGFLHAIGVRARPDRSRDPDDASVGIACAACHAVHGDHVGKALVRAVAPPASVSRSVLSGASAMCSSCHAPGDDELVASASSAALVVGSVGLPEALGGELLQGPAPHGMLSGGCVACHGASRGRDELDHSFQVDRATCLACHAAGAPAEALDAGGLTVRQRALALMARIRRLCGDPSPSAPNHADGRWTAPCGGSPNLGRAAFLASLVVADGAASVHNAAFARELLERAQALVPSAAPGRRPSQAHF
jgi:Cytochrome c554 and c-prime